MISNIDNIKIIVQLLKQNHIKKIVISPGGTNIPLFVQFRMILTLSAFQWLMKEVQFILQ